jgi:HAD superfamily hydrolase (TIGR01484 family)
MTDDMTKLANHGMVLATDLDGTFLGGDEVDRDRLYDWVRGHRDSIGLIFVTGRDPDFIIDVCRSGRVPWPDYVVGDVGTTIAHVDDARKITPMPSLEAEIESAWGARGEKVRKRLHGHPGLTLQATSFRFRVSYDMDPHAFDDIALQIVDDIGADALISDNRFFDVLPRGVSKGPSLLRLIDHLDVDRARVLTAGDTLNDLSMLVAGTPAVAVGGAERALLQELPNTELIYRASAIGAAGILEAVRAFGLHPVAAVA